MKKLIALLLAATMLLSLCACGSPKVPEELEGISDEDWEAAAEALEDMYEEDPVTEPVTETEPAEKIYQLGESCTNEDGTLEVKIDSFGFTDVINNSELAPATDDAQYWADNGCKAEEGKTYFYYTGTVTLVEDVKQESIFYNNFTLRYNNDYRFVGGSLCVFVDGVRTKEIEPLMGIETVEFRGYTEVPKSVETDEEGSLLMDFIFREALERIPRSEFTVQLR